MQLLIRVFTDTSTEVQARDCGARAAAVLATALGRTPGRVGAPQRDHRDALRFEHTLCFDPATHADVRALLALEPHGWTPPRIEDAVLQVQEDEDASLVWHRTPGRAWLVSEVCWAELRYQHPPDAAHAARQLDG